MEKMSKFPIRFQRLKALLIKEFHQILRDPSSLLIAVIFPILLLFLYGYGVSLDLDHLKIGLIVEDHSKQAESLAGCIRHSKFFDVTEGMTKQELERELIAGNIHGIVTIPFYFQKYREIGLPAPIFAAADGESPNTANFFQNYVEGAWMNWRIRDAIETQKTDLRYANASPRFWYNEELESHYFLIPGSIGIIMTLIGTLLTALVVAREWERGTIEALLATPITMLEFLLAKILAYFCLGMFSLLFCFLASIFLFSVPYRGSIHLLILVSSVFLLVSLSGGLLISSFSRDQFIASQMAIMSSFLPAYSLSGFIFEVTSMPLWIQAIAEFIPAKYFVSCLQTLYLVGDIPNLIFSNLAYLTLLGCLPIFIIFIKTKKRLN